MPPTHPAYPAEFKQQMVELVRAGPSPSELAKEFEPSGQTIRNWVVQADRDEGIRVWPVMSEKSCVVFVERISSCAPNVRYCQKQRPGSQGRPTRSPESLRVREGAPGTMADCHAMPRAGCLKERVLCVERTSVIEKNPGRCGSQGAD